MSLNPYIQQKVDRYTSLRQQIVAMQTRATVEGRDLTGVEIGTVKHMGAQAKDLYDEIEPEIEEHQRTASVAAMQARIADAVAGGGEFTNLAGGRPDPYADGDAGVPSLMPSREQVAEMRAAVADGRPLKFTTAPRQREHVRATVTLAGDVGTPTAAMPSREPVEPRRVAVAANLTTTTVDGVAGVAFPVFLAGAAGVTAEVVAKAMYDNIAPGTAAPQVINVWTDFTRQASTSHLAFESRLRAKLAALVAVREDQLLHDKVMAATGIQTQVFAAAPTVPGLVLNGCAKVQAAVGADPDVILCKPADTGFLLAAGVGSASQEEIAELALRLYGAVVYPTASQTAGLVLVGAWRASTRLVVGMRPTFMIDPFTQMKTNVITGLLEEAVDLAVEEPEGFISVDILTP